MIFEDSEIQVAAIKMIGKDWAGCIILFYTISWDILNIIATKITTDRSWEEKNYLHTSNLELEFQKFFHLY